MRYFIIVVLLCIIGCTYNEKIDLEKKITELKLEQQEQLYITTQARIEFDAMEERLKMCQLEQAISKIREEDYGKLK